MSPSLNFYSAQTRLAYEISSRYFGYFHVYIADEYDPPSNPSSSNPKALCALFRRIEQEDDRGDPKYKTVRAALRKAARDNRKRGLITDNQYKDVQELINRGGTRYFSPLLYVIQRAKIDASRLKRPNIRANPVSREIIIPDLKADEFEVLWL